MLKWKLPSVKKNVNYIAMAQPNPRLKSVNIIIVSQVRQVDTLSAMSAMWPSIIANPRLFSSTHVLLFNIYFPPTLHGKPSFQL